MVHTETQKNKIEQEEETKINIDRYRSDNYICTVCGYLGKPKNNTKGSFIIEVVLWLFLIIPGLLYSLWRITNKYRGCPKCKSTAIIPIDTPNGQALYKSLHDQKYSREKHNDDEYRMQVREEAQPFSRKGLFVLVAFIVICVLFGMILNTINPAEQFEKAEKTTRPSEIAPSLIPAVKVAEGDFMTYRYEIAKREDAEEYAAVFTPFLPSNDAILTGAMFTVMSEIYGKHNLTDLKPEFVPINGVNHVRFKGTDSYFYFLPIKQDTGEIHTFKFWKG